VILIQYKAGEFNPANSETKRGIENFTLSINNRKNTKPTKGWEQYPCWMETKNC